MNLIITILSAVIMVVFGVQVIKERLPEDSNRLVNVNGTFETITLKPGETYHFNKNISVTNPTDKDMSFEQEVSALPNNGKQRFQDSELVPLGTTKEPDIVVYTSDMPIGKETKPSKNGVVYRNGSPGNGGISGGMGWRETIRVDNPDGTYEYKYRDH